jgi:hypothetical protein
MRSSSFEKLYCQRIFLPAKKVHSPNEKKNVSYIQKMRQEMHEWHNIFIRAFSHTVHIVTANK